MTTQASPQLPSTRLANLTPSTLREAKELALDFARSGLFGSSRDPMTPEKAFVKLLRGNDLGVTASEAMEQIHVIEGKTSLSAGLLTSLVQKSPQFRYKVLRADATGCVLEFLERIDGVWESCGQSSFTIEDAKRAELTTKTVWKKYPEDMCFARALARGVRRFCNSITGGSVYVTGELDEIDSAPKPVGNPAFAPDRARAGKAEAAAEELLAAIPDSWGLAVDARRDLVGALERSRSEASTQATEVLEGLARAIATGMAQAGAQATTPAPAEPETIDAVQRDSKPDNVQTQVAERPAADYELRETPRSAPTEKLERPAAEPLSERELSVLGDARKVSLRLPSGRLLGDLLAALEARDPERARSLLEVASRSDADQFGWALRREPRQESECPSCFGLLPCSVSAGCGGTRVAAEPEAKPLSAKEQLRAALDAEDAAAAKAEPNEIQLLAEARSSAAQLASNLPAERRGKARAAIDCAKDLEAVEKVRGRIMAGLAQLEDEQLAQEGGVDLGGLA